MKELTKKETKQVLDLLGSMSVPDAVKLLAIFGYHLVLVDKK